MYILHVNILPEYVDIYPDEISCQNNKYKLIFVKIKTKKQNNKKSIRSNRYRYVMLKANMITVFTKCNIQLMFKKMLERFNLWLRVLELLFFVIYNFRFL